MKINISNLQKKYFIIDINKRTTKYLEYLLSDLQYQYKKFTPIQVKYDSIFKQFKYHRNNDSNFYEIPEDCLIEVNPIDNPEYFI